MTFPYAKSCASWVDIMGGNDALGRMSSRCPIGTPWRSPAKRSEELDKALGAHLTTNQKLDALFREYFNPNTRFEVADLENKVTELTFNGLEPFRARIDEEQKRRQDEEREKAEQEQKQREAQSAERLRHLTAMYESEGGLSKQLDVLALLVTMSSSRWSVQLVEAEARRLCGADVQRAQSWVKRCNDASAEYKTLEQRMNDV